MRFIVTLVTTFIAGLGVFLFVLAFSYNSLADEIAVNHTTKFNENNIRLTNIGQAFQNVLTKLDFPEVPSFISTNSQEVPILMYHYVRNVNRDRDQLGYNLSVSPNDFELQVRAFIRNGYNFITPSEFLEGQVNNRSIMLTFDDGYADFYDNAFPILKRYRLKATVFVVSDFVDDSAGNYLTSEQIIELERYGIEIGSHSVTHPNLTNTSNQELDRQLLRSKTFLEDLIGKPVTSFAYPAGHYDDRVLAAMERAGYKFAVTTEHGFGSLKENLLTQKRIRINGGDGLERIFSRIER